MTAAGRPRVRLLLSCADPDDYARNYAPRFAADGAPIHTTRLRPIGADVTLVVELLDGQVVYEGLATVVAHLEVGGPGFILALVPSAEAPAMSSDAREYLFEELRTASDEPEPVLEFWSTPPGRRGARGG